MNNDKATVLGSSIDAPSVLARFGEAKKVVNEARGSKSATTSFRMPAETKAKFKNLADHYGLDQVEVLVILIHSAHKAVFGDGPTE